MKILFTFCCFLPLFLTAQNDPACDSLIINYHHHNSDTLVLEVYNNSQLTLFDYPGFMLVDSLGDTIAMESVSYFGISVGPQLHYLLIMDSTFMTSGYFEGFLQLYTGFYDSLRCTFPFNLGTLATTKYKIETPNFRVYPNPLKMETQQPLIVYFESNSIVGNRVSLHNSLGQLLKEIPLQSSIQQLEVTNLPSGVYVLSIKNGRGQTLGVKKILLE